MASDGIQLPIEVTGSAEAQLKRIADAVQNLDRKGGASIGNFGDVSKKAFDVFTKGAVVVGSIKLIKEALDLTFEAETVRATSAQFDLLTKSAGISGDALRDSLVGAADGLIDDTDLIQIANKAIVTLGSSAAGIAPIMELARKATSIFGGDLKSNFEALNQAIATGQTRALKQFGIVIDSEKAYRDFAASIGKAGETLSETGKQQAIMEAVLSKGNDQFKNVDVNLKAATDSYQRFSVTISQIGEIATLAFEKLAGEKVRSALGFVGDAAKNLNRFMQASFGEGAEKAKANVEGLSEKVRELKVAVIDSEQAQNKHRDAYEKFKAGGSLDLIRAELAKYEEQLAEAEVNLLVLNAEQGNAVSANKKAAASYIDQSVALKKLSDEGESVARRLASEDIDAKYERDLLALETFLDSKATLTAEDKALFDQLELDRDTKLGEKRAKEISDLNDKNQALREIDAEINAEEIRNNQKKIAAILDQEDKSSKTYLNQKRQEAAAEFQIRQASAQAVSGILGNLANVAKAYGAEGFAVFQGLAKAQALVDTFAGANAAYKSAAAVPVIGPVLAPIAAAAAVAAGLANVAMINKQKPAFAQGGIVPGFSTSGDQVDVRANSGEMFLNRPQQTRLLDIASGRAGAGSGDGAMLQILSSIDSKLSRLSTVVNIDGREVFNSMRSQLQSGRAFT